MNTLAVIASWASGVILGTIALVWLLSLKREAAIIRLKGFRWTRQQLCQHVLITGATGSGKTRSGIVALLLELFRNDKEFGGLCVDEKGVLHEVIVDIARNSGRAEDVILLEVAPKPRHRFNLVGNRALPFATLAQCVVDTAVAMGNQHEQSFFRSAAQIHIAKALEALHEAGFQVTLENAHNLLVNPADTQRALRQIKSPALVEHFEQYLAQPPEQLAGVTGTVRNYLHHFTSPEIAEVFCRDSTFDLADVDRGKIVCISMPQRYQTERRFVGTFLKLLFFNHALTRFDAPKAVRDEANLLVLVVDECQHFVTTSEHGMSDHNVIDVVREAKLAVIAATQSTTSLVPVLGLDRARVYTLNMRSRLIFTAADEVDARESADFLGKKDQLVRSLSSHGGRITESVRDQDEYRVKPNKLRKLRKNQCVLVHSEDGFRKVTLPPREADGSISEWYRWRWFRR
ncbi:MAG TPA: type IV secretion system DNA-binding domain-containing protein [Verrucomicrobiota bacterium]|nr:hypothetical protein [Verrucomicrobiales bacterium]HRI12323.1 type IV secretion system DNA-binding domain-containing protein [Verrucomicrobiota bacterium]